MSQRIEKTEEGLTARLKRQESELELAIKDREEGKPSTAQVIFAMMNRAGLAHRFSELVGSAEDVAYWKTGLFLMNSFLVDEANRDKYVTAAELIVESEELAPSSLGFNLYLLGKMEQFRGNTQKAMSWFERCKQRTPQMYDHLMAQDPAYDLEAVRKYLLKQETN